MKALFSSFIKGKILILTIVMIVLSISIKVDAETNVADEKNQEVQNSIINEKINQIENDIEELKTETKGKIDTDTYKDVYDKTVAQMNDRIESITSDKDFMYSTLLLFATFVAGIATFLAINDHINSKKAKAHFEELTLLKTQVAETQLAAAEAKTSAVSILAEIEASATSIEETKKEIDVKAEKIGGFYTKFDDLENKSVGIITIMSKLKDAFEVFNKDGSNDNFKQAVAEVAHEASGIIDNPTTQKISDGLEIENEALLEEIDANEL
ncbi:hypothetical protein F4694_005682 [Bacillus niacini]|uniref:Uncharacterized protein n=1 Tax=Neobacillus niacini TaxID=86668 RepID=A0A852TMB1_9BACI|nr:hypothetical protein [Neobacillus niacini]NYE08826.1 hypothetical protein [Neobacillus niacini]